jgi:L-ascorbate metabolism protein UlaG (beta-lactamase superfamily)
MIESIAMTFRYQNPPGSPQRNAMPMDYISFFARRVATTFASIPVPEGHVFSRGESLAHLEDARDGDSVTWLGHAAFFIRLKGVGLLIDPFLSRTAGPGAFGPHRFAGPEIGIDDLGTIDALLITHNHYDHLDATTLRHVARQSSIPAITSQGLSPLLGRLGFRDVTELAWDEQKTLDGVTVTSTPAIHWSKRGAFDENQSHWCGFLIESETYRIYFTGDTAYGPVFKEMGDRWGAIDLGIVPIGAYEPASIMAPVHTTPEEAVQIAKDTNCKGVIPMHWGTIVLSDEDPWEPPVRFREAAKSNGYDDGQILQMRIGETIPLRHT